MAIDIKLFAVMPFSDDFKPVWDCLSECIDKLNIVYTTRSISISRADASTEDQTLLGNVTNQLDACDIAIIDISSENNNVVFEFGYVIAKGKKIIGICSTTIKDLSTDYRAYVYTQYDQGDLETFRSQIRLRVVEEIKKIDKEEEQRNFKESIIEEQDRMHFDLFRNREVAPLKVKFKEAQKEINVLTTNMTTILDQYGSSIDEALKRNPNLTANFLSLDPESHFAAGRAIQLGEDVFKFRANLHKALLATHEKFSKYPKVEIRIYDDFPTQISFLIDNTAYNCVVSKYQTSRKNCVFELDLRYPSINTSFYLHFTSVWRDKYTTKAYIPQASRFEKEEIPSTSKE